MSKMIDSFKQLSTAAVSDALDKLGREGACLGIKALSNDYKIVGRAFTLKYEPVAVEKGTVGDYIEDIPEGYVAVLDNAGRLDCTVWGDILTSVAKSRGIAGTVINGVCRDVAHSLKVGYPIFSKSQFMRTGKDRVQLEATNVPISLGSIRVNPGDILVCDADGVVVVPKEIEEKVLEIAQMIDNAEEAIRKDVEAGLLLVDARKKHKYHHLQTSKG